MVPMGIHDVKLRIIALEDQCVPHLTLHAFRFVAFIEVEMTKKRIAPIKLERQLNYRHQ
jgi:hypothetical protein